MIKIIWLCNVRFSEKKITHTGSWLQPLAECLHESNRIQLINICRDSVPSVTKEIIKGIEQYVIPVRIDKKYGQVPEATTQKEIINIVTQEKPNLIHIWGTESIWAYMNTVLSNSFKTLIDIQGLLAPYANYYYGGLTNKEILNTIHLKEVLIPTRNLYYKKKIFKDRGKIETKLLQTFSNISVQSNWVNNYINFIAPNSNIYFSRIMLRESFYKADPWFYKVEKDSPIIYSSCAAAVSYKGIHILIKAVNLLKKKYPKIQLHLAGTINVGNKLLDGYSIFLNNLIKKYKLEKNVRILGPINENQIIKELQECSVCVIPSFIETYCLAFAESMIIGVPTIATYTGALPELAEHNKEALFYNSIDYYTLAGNIDKLIQDRNLSEFLSFNCRKRRFIENNRDLVVENQLNIYKSILNRNESQN